MFYSVLWRSAYRYCKLAVIVKFGLYLEDDDDDDCFKVNRHRGIVATPLSGNLCDDVCKLE